MVLDKFGAVRVLPKISWFALFGLGNLFCYSLSHMLPEKDYKYYFAHTGEGRLSTLIRSNFGSDRFSNIMWTAPALIVAGQYMHGKVGALTMFKFTPLAVLSILCFQSAFGPNPETRALPNFRLLGGILPKWDASGPGYYMGADMLACSVFYFAMLYHRMWTPALLLMGFDFLYYGPRSIGAFAPAVVAASTLL